MPRATKTPALPDPIAGRIRARRLAAGMTLEALARAASGIRSGSQGPVRRPASVSASYLCLIEQGRKVPDEPIAAALALALGDDVGLYRAWVRLRKRADLGSVLEAAETLRRALAATPAAPTAPTAATAHAGDGVTRLRLPVIREGDDPGEGVRPGCEVLEWLRWDASLLAPELRERLDRPVAWRVSPAGVARVGSFLAPDTLAVVLRSFLPLRDDRAYAIRQRGGVVLSRALWNGSQLLLLPAAGRSGFELLPARGEASLRALILGLAIPLPPESVHAVA